MIRFALALTLGLSLAAPAAAQSVKLEGSMAQGGLVTGRVDPGTKLSLDGKPVKVAADGRFVFGFGRDAAPTSELIIEAPNGTRSRASLDVKTRRYQVERVDGLPPAQVTPPPAELERIKRDQRVVAEARRIDSALMHFAAGFVWPAKGRISGVYGSQRILNGEPRQPHYGVDVVAPVGSPVKAAAAGLVTLAEDLYFTGNTVMIDHGHGVSTTYSHLDKLSVAKGQAVRQNQTIGTLGGTGRATGPHLDWRMNWYDVRIDPQLVVGPMNGN